MRTTAGKAAFFDVDETLITVKSMFRFLDHHLHRRGLPRSVYEQVRDDLQRMARSGVPREDTNRAYYEMFAGQSVSRLAEQGLEWFATEMSLGDLFNEHVLDALRAHRHEGTLVVLVSGSFPPCTGPVADYVGADAVLCTGLEVRDGRYTGAVRQPVIGAGKRLLAERFMVAHGLPAEACHAYGDHSSDLPLLTAVGHPVVVGDDAELARRAERLGWDRLPGITFSIDDDRRPSTVRTGQPAPWPR